MIVRLARSVSDYFSSSLSRGFFFRVGSSSDPEGVIRVASGVDFPKLTGPAGKA